MVTVRIELPEDVYLALQSAGLNLEQLESQAVRDLAVQLYNDGRLTLGKAAKLSQLPIAGFWQLLVNRGLPVVHYSEEEYENDINTIKNLPTDVSEK